MSATTTNTYSNKDILKISFPVLMSLLMEHLIGLTDTAYLGRVGEVELGACALAGVYYLVIYMLGFGFSVGAQVMMARRHGSGEHRRMGEVFNQGLLFMLGFAALMFVLSHLYSPALLSRLIESEAVLQATNDYIYWRVFGFFFSFVGLMFRAFFVSTTHTRTLTVNSLVMVGTNVVLNYVLIFGKLGLPALGISGAAIASSVSEAVSTVFFLIYTLRRVDYRISYTLPPFTVGQSRELIASRPEWLSLGEMCRLAECYPVDSPERAYVCATALEFYPDDPYACNNMAALALRCGDIQTARQCLNRCAGAPCTLNNLGILCLIDGDSEKARYCFSLAAEYGSGEGTYNLAHFDELSCKW